jgi:hypothetical protein
MKLLHNLKITAALVIAAAIIGFTAFEENEGKALTSSNLMPVLTLKTVAEEISSISSFRQAGLFTLAEESAVLKGSIRKFSSVSLNNETVTNILAERPANLEITIPVKDGHLVTLQLTENILLAEDFRMINKTSNGEQIVNVNSNAMYYKGIIKGNEKSVAAISIFEGMVMGVISDENGNYVIGPVNPNPSQKKLMSANNEHVFYNEADLIQKNEFTCWTEEHLERSVFKSHENIDPQYSQTDNTAIAIKVFFVCDYDMYQLAGGNLQVISNYVNGIFNSVKTMYQNEQIDMLISTIQVYSSPDPMSFYDDSYEIRQVFGAQIQNNMQGGHIAHLLSTRDISAGGIAYIRSLCKQYNPADSSGSYAYSNIESNYEPYPTYSFTTLVVTHEMGHNIGSRHTHACVWPINNTIRSIDTCTINGENEPCFPPGFQSRPAKGTIMSYCHFWQNQPPYGTNLALGFGPLPGDTIRLRYAQAQGCLSIGIQQISSEIPADYILMQNYPNPFNPATNINFALPTTGSVKLTVFDVTGKTLAVLVDSKLSAGSYSFDWDASAYTSGVYLYKLEFTGSNSDAEFTQTKKMVLIK